MKLIKGILLIQVMLFTTGWFNSFCLCCTGPGSQEQFASAGCCGDNTAQACCTGGEQLAGQGCFQSGNTAVAIQTPVNHRAGSVPLNTFLVTQIPKVKTAVMVPGTDSRAPDCLRTSRLVALLI